MNNVIIFNQNLDFFRKKVPRPALFLDRDGVIIKEMNYLSDPNKVALEDGVLDLLTHAFNANWRIIVITNQSGISRGLLTWVDYQKVTERMIELIGQNNLINGIYANDVIDDTDMKTWRKPSPSMLLEASNDFNIDIKNSILIGDRYTDLLAGFNAKVKKVYHVLTGNGESERRIIINNLDSFDNIKSHQGFKKVFFIDSLMDFDMKNFLS